MHNTEICVPILKWYQSHGRHNLPWQVFDVYIRWISEVMLQQTQVQTVIPYFERFMRAFPSVLALARASEDEVLNLWTGLGYYSRARNIHRSAQIIMTDYGGVLPTTADEWQKLPGVGQSTAAAIIAQALDTPMAILDANVKRVLARYFGVYGTDAKSTKALWRLSNDILPMSEGANFAQALMDFGATLCTVKKPCCRLCPINAGCYAYIHEVQDELPSKKSKRPTPTKKEYWAYIKDGKRVLLMKNNELSGVWRGLWRLPSFNHKPTEEDLQPFARNLVRDDRTEVLSHRFSHYALTATIDYWYGEAQLSIAESSGLLWYDANAPASIGLPQPIKKLLHP